MGLHHFGVAKRVGELAVRGWPMNISLWLQRMAQAYPQRPALFVGVQQIADYGQFEHRSAQAAAWFKAAGIRPGDRIALYLTNVPEYLILLYGAWYAGAAVVPINAKLHPREAAWIIEDGGVALTFASTDLAAPLRAQAGFGRVIDLAEAAFSELFDCAADTDVAVRAAEDLAWLFYTSGTTGRPKGVMITHRMLQVMALAYLSDVDTVETADTAIYAAPLSHGAGLYNVMHVLAGARHVLPPSGRFEALEIFDLARHFERAHLFAAPTMVKRMTETAKATGQTGAGLRSVIYGGGPMYQEDIIAAVDHFGPIFIQIYGQGECPMCITALSRADVADRNHPRWRARLASVGRPQAAVQVRIADEQGRSLPNGETGEIIVRGDAVMPGYWQNPKATAQALGEGWLHTGDMGQLDDEGYLTLKDRSKDMIISGGSNIYPREVEEVLLTHPSVSEVSVVGCADAEWGEVVVAFVVVQSGYGVDDAALAAHCLAHIARFKRPKTYIEIAELPKNNYGKVLKTALRARLNERALVSGSEKT